MSERDKLQSQLTAQEKQSFIRTTAVNLGIYKYVFTSDTDEYFPLDIESWSADTAGNKTPVGIEIKVREKDQSFFDREAPLLELKKLRGMVREREEIYRRKGLWVELFYMNISADGVVTLFKLKEEENYHWFKKMLPRSKYDRRLVEKEVALLNYEPYQRFVI